MGKRLNLGLFVSVILLLLVVTLQINSIVSEVNYETLEPEVHSKITGMVTSVEESSSAGFFTTIWSSVKRVFSLTGYATYISGSDVSVSSIYPTSNINVTERTFFNVSFDVSCSLADCGDINVSLASLQAIQTSSGFENGDFETGDLTSWNSISGVSVVSADKNSGVYSGQMYSYESGCSDGVVSHISREVTLPEAATLRFYYKYTGSRDGGFCDTEYGNNCQGHRSYPVADFVISETSAWTKKEISLPAGTHTLTWYSFAWCYSAGTLLIDDVCFVDGNDNCIDPSGGSINLVPIDSDSTPFYTNKSSNPVTINLGSGESEVVTFWMNATGDVGSSVDIYPHVQLVGNDSVTDTSSSFNVEIISMPNVAPTNPTDLTLSMAYVNRDLTAAGSGSTDLNGDSIIYFYEFYNVNDNTVLQSYSTDNTYTPISSDEGDTIEVRVKAYDSEEYSLSSYSETIVVQSEPTTSVTIDTLTISPSSPRTTDDLVAAVKGVSSLGNPLIYYYNWTVDGSATGVSGKMGTGGIFVSISASFAVLQNGSYATWGYGLNNELGTGSTLDKEVPVIVNPGVEFTKIEGGWYILCGFLEDGKIYCWGRNDEGPLGDGTKNDASTPKAIDSSNTYLMIGGGRDHTCGIRKNGDAYCWGYDNKGQLGNGASGATTTPALVSGGHKFKDICGGREHSCGILENGSVMCWGDNSYSQLGRSGGNSDIPVFVDTGYLFKEVTCGEHVTCGILTTGRVACWGNGYAGALGDGGSTNNLVPTLISTTNNFTFLDMTYRHVCGVLENGRVMCWGENSNGQLGNNNRPTDSYTPVFTSSTNEFSSVYAGYEHSCGLMTNGSVMCWGTDANGRLGTDSVSGVSEVPVFVDLAMKIGSSLYPSGNLVTLPTLTAFYLTGASYANISVWASDGDENSAVVTEGVVFSPNGLPTTPTTLNLVTSPFNVGDTVTASCSGSTDSDGDSISYYVEFYNTNSSTVVQAYSTDNTYVLQTSDSRDKIEVRCKAYDGIDYSTGIKTATLNVINSAPSMPTDISYLAPFRRGITTTFTASGSTDIDSDSITYYYEFYDTNTSTVLQGYSTNNLRNPGVAEENHVVEIRVKAYDGELYSDVYSIQVLVLPPAVVEVRITDPLTLSPRDVTINEDISVYFIVLEDSVAMNSGVTLNSVKVGGVGVSNSGFGYVLGEGWGVNFTVPNTLSGLVDLEIDATYTGNYSGVNDVDLESDSLNVLTSDTVPPVITQISNVTLEPGVSLSLDVDATDNFAIDTYYINDTTRFSIDSNGVITNSTSLSPGIYYLNVGVNDTSGNTDSEVIWIKVKNYVLEVRNPTTENPQSVLATENVTVGFNYLVDSVNVTSGVTLNQVTVGGNSFGSASLGSEVYYYNSYSGSDWTSPSSVVDGNTGTAGYTNGNDRYVDLTGFSGVVPDSVVNSVEVRVYANDWGYSGNAVKITPYFSGSTAGSSYTLETAGSFAWTAWTDITNSANAPATWSASDVNNLDLKLQAIISTYYVDVAKVEIRVNYTQSSVPTAYYDNGWKIDLKNMPNLVGLQDLFIEATYNSQTRSHNEEDAFSYGGSDETPPTFTGISNITITEFDSLNFKINATDNIGISNFSVNDSDFGISSTGLLTNATKLSKGYHYLNVTVTDSSGNSNSETMWVFVKYYEVSVTSPRTSNPMSVNVGDNITVGFDYLLGSDQITSGVTLDNVTVGGSSFLGTPQAGQVTFYYNGYSSFSGSYATRIVDGSLSTYSLLQSGQSGRLNSLNYATQSGEITKVEFRVYGYSDFMASTLGMQPYYSGSTAGQKYTYDVPASAGWTSYYDITSSANAPSSWSWSDVENMDFNVNFDAGMTRINIAKVEVCVSYETQTGPSAYYSNGWKIDLENLPDLEGLQDLFVEATYNGITRSDTEVDSLSFPAPDTTPPTFLDLENLMIEYGQSLSHDFDASDISGIDTFWINDTSNFAISSSGLLTNASSLNIGTYVLNISVNDTFGNVASDVILVEVVELGELQVELISPTGGPNSQPQNELFTLRANITCSGNGGATCGNVNGYLRYNGSSINPDTNVVGSGGPGVPFYSIESNPKTCGEMGVGNNPCQLVWQINATGALSSIHLLDVDFTSSLSISNNDTFDTLLKIISPTLSIVLSDDLFNVDFGNGLTPGTENNPAVDNSLSGYNITCLHAQGNCNISIRGNDDLASGINNIGVGNISWNGIDDNSAKKSLGLEYNVINPALADLASQNIFFWLDLPSNILAGDYKTNFTISGQSG